MCREGASASKTNLFVALFTAILAFIGALGGSYLSGYQAKSLWIHQINFEEKKQILEQRIKLIERVSRLANSAPQMKSFQGYVDLQSRLSQEYYSKNIPEQTTYKPDSVSKALEIGNKRSELNAEFASTLQLVDIYFGPVSQVSVEKLAKLQPWWELGEPGFRELINSMRSEVYYDDLVIK